MDVASFGVVYALFVLVVSVAAFRMIRARDKTGVEELPPAPAVFDPYEIAFLRGGRDAVIRTVIYALYQRGRVDVIPASLSGSAGWWRRMVRAGR
jgi:uncharacterized protein (TIGR04222 family)